MAELTTRITHQISICLNCICLPICKFKSSYNLITECSLLNIAVRELQTELVKDRRDFMIIHYLNRDYEIYLKDDTTMQIRGMPHTI